MNKKRTEHRMKTGDRITHSQKKSSTGVGLREDAEDLRKSIKLKWTVLTSQLKNG